MVSEGHTLGLHSYTHNYDLIYSSAESFLQDIDSLRSYIINNTGYVPTVLRFPGGSNYYKLKRSLFYSLKPELSKRGLVYFDWNVTSADSSRSTLTVNDVLSNCYSAARNRNIAIILMHDSSIKKKIIADALPTLIDKLRREGFVFSTLAHNTPQIVFRK